MFTPVVAKAVTRRARVQERHERIRRKVCVAADSHRSPGGARRVRRRLAVHRRVCNSAGGLSFGVARSERVFDVHVVETSSDILL